MKNISILGCTGSIGTQAIAVCRKIGYNIVGLSANKNAEAMRKLIDEVHPEFVSLTDRKAAVKLKNELGKSKTKVLSGSEGNCFIASLEENDIVLNSIVGIDGLLPTVSAINAKKNVALANKESLACAGELVMSLAKKNRVKIFPVDSEHSAIFQSLRSGKQSEIKKIILTASGGPFYGKSLHELENVSIKDALNHPNWSMGAKITVDSATLMNKGLEVIEAVWLFGVSPDDIEVVVHRESVVHSMIEFADNSIIAQLGVPDMKIPIQYALTYPDRLDCEVKRLNVTDYGTLSFYKPDTETFRCLRVCTDAIRTGGLYPCAANCANEESVSLFLNGKIRFTQIGEIISRVTEKAGSLESVTMENIKKTNNKARKLVRKYSEM